MSFCENCGKELEGSAIKYCPHCGAKNNGAAEHLQISDSSRMHRKKKWMMIPGVLLYLVVVAAAVFLHQRNGKHEEIAVIETGQEENGYEKQEAVTITEMGEETAEENDSVIGIGKKETDRTENIVEIELPVRTAAGSTYEYEIDGNVVYGTCYDQNGKLWYTTTEVYDREGNCTSRQQLDGNGEEDYTEKYEYEYVDEKLVSETRYRHDEPRDRIRYYYNEEGNLVKAINECFVNQSVYDSDGNLLKKRENDYAHPFVTTTDYFYTSEGFLESHSSYDDDGAQGSARYECDSKGKIQRGSFYAERDGQLILLRECQYDGKSAVLEDVKVVFVIFYTPEGEVRERYDYSQVIYKSFELNFDGIA